MVIIEASSGPCVFIDSAPSMLSPSSICTSALASGPSPMPPYSFGTNGHHKPCARALARSLPSTSSSGLLSSSFSAGMHSSCTHLRARRRQGAAAAVAAWIFLDPCDVAPGGAAVGRQVHTDYRRPAGLWLVG